MLQTAACSAMSAATSLAVDVIDLRVALGMGCLHCSGLGLPRCFSDAVGRSSRLFRNVQITNFSARRMKIKLIKHEVIQDCGSYEVRFPLMADRPDFSTLKTSRAADCGPIWSNSR